MSRVEPKTGRLSNREWIDFLVAQFDISRTSARDMLHVMMQVKREDNFKKQFSQRNGYLAKDLVKDEED